MENRVFEHTPIKVERIATVKATGRRYVVSRISFPRGKGEPTVFTHGGVNTAKQLINGGAVFESTSYHKFKLSEVHIAEKRFTFELATELWKEHHEAHGRQVRISHKGNGRVDAGGVTRFDIRQALSQLVELAS